MFHVEHIGVLVKQLLFLTFALLAITSCDKPEQQPWLRDPIYQDMQKKKKDLEGKVQTQTGELEKLKAILDAAVPQTGQAKTARKKVEGQTNVLEKMKQVLRIHKIQIEARVADAQKEYLEAFNQKKPWPAPDEYSEYQLGQKLNSQSRNWNVDKRREELGLPPLKRGVSGVGPKDTKMDAEKSAEH